MGGGAPLTNKYDWQLVAQSLGIPKETPPYRIREIIGDDEHSICRQKCARSIGHDEARPNEIIEALSRKHALPSPGLGDRN